MGLLIRWFRVRPPGAPPSFTCNYVITTCGGLPPWLRFWLRFDGQKASMIMVRGGGPHQALIHASELPRVSRRKNRAATSANASSSPASSHDSSTSPTLASAATWNPQLQHA
jgi:hypothetical protein